MALADLSVTVEFGGGEGWVDPRRHEGRMGLIWSRGVSEYERVYDAYGYFDVNRRVLR